MILTRLVKCIGLPKLFVSYFTLRFVNIPISGTTAEDLCTGPFHCHICTKSFNTFQKHSLHMFKSHGIKNIMRRYLEDVVCPVCLMYFHSGERVLNHMRYRSRVCKNVLMSRLPVLTEKQADLLDKQAASENATLAHSGLRRHHVTHTAFRFSGPLNNISSTPRVTHTSQHRPFGSGRNYRHD